MIQVSRPNLSDLEYAAIIEAIRGGRTSSGTYVKKFEDEFAEFCGSKYATSINNGTIALWVALKALKIGPSDRVIVPALSYVAPAHAVALCGAIPIFCGSTSYGCLDPECVAQAMTTDVKAVIAVHLYGHPCNMGALRSAVGDVPIIEDAAEAHGARYRGKPAGSLGDMGCFSFYGNKIITSGEGGMITTNSRKLKETCSFFKGQAVATDRRFWHTGVGFNGRLSNLNCALGWAQLQRIEEFARARASILDEYQKRIKVWAPKEEWAEPALWMVSALSKQRNKVFWAMDKAGIESRPFFPLISDMPPYKNFRYYPSEHDRILSEQGINLPTYVGLSVEQIDYICSVIGEVL